MIDSIVEYSTFYCCSYLSCEQWVGLLTCCSALDTPLNCSTSFSVFHLFQTTSVYINSQKERNREVLMKCKSYELTAESTPTPQQLLSDLSFWDAVEIRLGLNLAPNFWSMKYFKNYSCMSGCKLRVWFIPWFLVDNFSLYLGFCKQCVFDLDERTLMTRQDILNCYIIGENESVHIN